MGGTPIVAYTHKQIDAHRGSVSEQVAAKARIDLDRVLARYNEVMGDGDEEAGGSAMLPWRHWTS